MLQKDWNSLLFLQSDFLKAFSQVCPFAIPALLRGVHGAGSTYAPRAEYATTPRARCTTAPRARYATTPRARQYLCPERGSTSDPSGAAPLHRARRTGKFDFTYTIRFAVRFKFSLTENLMKKHRGGGAQSTAVGTFRAAVLISFEHCCSNA